MKRDLLIQSRMKFKYPLVATVYFSFIYDVIVCCSQFDCNLSQRDFGVITAVITDVSCWREYMLDIWQLNI